MAKSILTGEPFSRNDISVLVHLFEQSFDCYVNHNALFFSDYLKALRTVAGLGFTASLVDRSLFNVYWHYLERFLAQEEGDFKINPGAKRGIAQAVAEMINTASLCFYALNFPHYYDDFIVALRYLLAQLPLFTGERAEAERLLAHLVIR